jgi:tetratricopeptide (TPR) repeat protein
LTARSLKDASAAADEGTATADHMAKLDAADPRTLKAQIMAAYKLADVRKEALDLKGTVADCREAERLARTLVAKLGTDAEALRLQWVASEKLGEALLVARDPAARTTLERATELARGLLNAHASDPARQRDVALSLASEGRAAQATGDIATALARFGDYLDAARKLVADHPSDSLFARDEALALISLAGAKYANGDRPGAEADLGAALNIVRRLANNDPLNARAKHDLLAALVARAQASFASDKAAARADLDEALKIARDFAALDGGSPRVRFDLATVLMQLALNFDDAKPFANEARAIVAGLATENLLTPADKATMAQFERQMQ